jgi:hypothetical protein
MLRLRALAALALGGAVAASAEPFGADYDPFEDALAPSPLGSPDVSYLEDPNAWLDRLRRSAEDIAAARPLVNDAYRGLFEDLAHARPERAAPWPRLFSRGGSAGDDESTPRKFRLRPETSRNEKDQSLSARLAAPAAAGDAVLGALAVSEEVLRRTAPDALDAASDVARVIQEQTLLAKTFIDDAETSDDADRVRDAPRMKISASFAADPRGPFASFPASGPGSFPDAETIRLIADPGTYDETRLFEFPFGTIGNSNGFGGVAASSVAARAAAAAERLYSSSFDDDARAAHSVAAKRALARLVDLTLEGQANAPVGRHFVDPTPVDRAKTLMEDVKANARERAFASSRDESNKDYAEDEDDDVSASPYDASFARGVELATSLREDDAEREARVRAELDLAGVLERQAGEGT